ncbi:hypothetical protein [Microcoleus sp. FACHB-672]|nr:hypothetical protein [Microcoleus sp. FACHB-672]
MPAAVKVEDEQPAQRIYDCVRRLPVANVTRFSRLAAVAASPINI